MSAGMPPYGSPNPYDNPYRARAEAERANSRAATPYAGATGPPPNYGQVSVAASQAPPYQHPYTSQAPPRRTAHTGRLANRFNGITMHQQPSSYPTAIGGQPAYSQPQNGYPAQANYHGQQPQSYPVPGQQYAQPTPPAMGGPQVAPQSTGQFPSVSSLQGALPTHPIPQQQTPAQAPQRPEYLIVGLFSLRITKHLIQQLDPYEGRNSDLHWIDNFLRPYHPDDALAKLVDPRVVDEYVSEYPPMVRRMIKQPRYRKVFMEMNPDKKVAHRELSDGELVSIIDFADAAGEWGSVVPLPGKYAERMEELAKGRRMAD